MADSDKSVGRIRTGYRGAIRAYYEFPEPVIVNSGDELTVTFNVRRKDEAAAEPEVDGTERKFRDK